MKSNWNNLSKDDKLDFIANHLNHSIDFNLLSLRVREIIKDNNMIDNWWSYDVNDKQDEKEKRWNSITQEEKIEEVKNEIESWDKIALIEFIVDRLTQDEIKEYQKYLSGESYNV